MNEHTPPPAEPDPKQGGREDLVTPSQATRMLHDAVGLVDGPTEQLADRLLLEEPGWFAAAYQQHFEAPVGVPLDALLHSGATIDQLAKAKSAGKRAFAAAGGNADVGLLLYYVAATVALVQYGRWITTIEPGAFEHSVALLAGCARGRERQALIAWLDLAADA